jgi:7,8-dihydroneopterin aldolase/epimerase/oxygenase
MAIIKVERIKLHAYHGCLPEEAKRGQTYYVDIAAEGNFSDAMHSDDLADTVDYCVIYEVVKREMMVRSNLIEQVAGRILQELKKEYSGYKFTVSVIKPAPPVYGEVEQVVFTLEG